MMESCAYNQQMNVFFSDIFSFISGIDCASVRWHVNTSSIQGIVEGLFTNATAKYKSQEHVSPAGPNVSFTGLYPGATYELYLWYENNSKHLNQCEHSQTISK